MISLTSIWQVASRSHLDYGEKLVAEFEQRYVGCNGAILLCTNLRVTGEDAVGIFTVEIVDAAALRSFPSPPAVFRNLEVALRRRAHDARPCW